MSVSVYYYHDIGEDRDDILTNEGRPGWIEKLLKEVWKHFNHQQNLYTVF